MSESQSFSTFIKSRRARRGALVFSFWALLLILVSTIAMTYVVPGQTHQSAYGDDWNDLGTFRSDISSMGIETTALVSSPLLLSEIDHPEEAVLVIFMPTLIYCLIKNLTIPRLSLLETKLGKPSKILRLPNCYVQIIILSVPNGLS